MYPQDPSGFWADRGHLAVGNVLGVVVVGRVVGRVVVVVLRVVVVGLVVVVVGLGVVRAVVVGGRYS